MDQIVVSQSDLVGRALEGSEAFPQAGFAFLPVFKRSFQEAFRIRLQN